MDEPLPSASVTAIPQGVDSATQAPANTEREQAIKAYNSAGTKEGRAAVVKQYPFLSEIFASINHS